MTTARAVVGLLVCLALTFSAAGIGSLFTRQATSTWYRTELQKPSWTPPAWLFAPVWTVLYAMMAVAAWLVWRRGGWSAGALPLVLFAVQLAFNAAWSALFFGLRLPGFAFAEIAVLWCLILATLIAFWRVSPVAGMLLVPYQAWVTFASALNFSIWRLNA